MRMKSTKPVWIVALSIMASACSDVKEPQVTDTAVSAEQATPAASAAVPQATNDGPRDYGHVGTVISATAAGGYTYLEVENSAGRFWIASSVANVKEGEQIRWGEFALMNNFFSKGLKKNFEAILFVSQVVPYEVDASVNEGEVVSVTEAAGYSYIEVNAGAKTLWVAAPVTPVAVGDKVSWANGSEMRNFFSKSLKRNFESILFVGGINVTKANAG